MQTQKSYLWTHAEPLSLKPGSSSCPLQSLVLVFSVVTIIILFLCGGLFGANFRVRTDGKNVVCKLKKAIYGLKQNS